MRGSGKFSFRRITSMGRSTSSRVVRQSSSQSFMGRTLSGFKNQKSGRGTLNHDASFRGEQLEHHEEHPEEHHSIHDEEPPGDGFHS